ncbi:MAG: 8-oxoguanine DNA glycosylase [Firmicutes bacterium]|nr:8-oxoguanine DNA glycosylase [Bacillota bacterium]
MKKIVESNKIILTNPTNFCPHQSIECGQMFRFRVTQDGRYTVYSGDKRCFVYSDGDNVVIETADTDYFANYFDFGRDYGAIVSTLSGYDELRSSVECGKGIRIFKQDLFETIISFIISANNHIPRIKSIIERICEAAGQKIDDYYAFPTPENLSRLTVEDFAKIGAGYRARYLAETSKVLAKTDMLQELAQANDKQVHKKLLSLQGIGEKVANCIGLFGLGITNSFPVDTWIFKTLSSDELNTPDKVRRYYQNRYGDLAGFAQQYLFWNVRTI